LKAARWITPMRSFEVPRMTVLGAERKHWHGSLPAAIGGIPENKCSSRAFLRVTRSGPWEAVTGMFRSSRPTHTSGGRAATLTKEAHDMSLVTGTARTGEAAAVTEAPLLDGRLAIIGTLAICTFYVGVRTSRCLAGTRDSIPSRPSSPPTG
jgi:hypothetical protein